MKNLKEANYKKFDVLNGLTMKIDGIPLAESKHQLKNATLHNNYCNDDIGDIDDGVPSYPATSTVYAAAKNREHSNNQWGKNVYVEESVKVLEQLILKADPLLQELASIVKEFEDKSQKSAILRD